MAAYQPRPYQAECIAALAEARTNGAKKGLVVMASGLGKTLTTAFDLGQFLQEQPNARILYLCHQEIILTQSKDKLKSFFGEEYSYGLFAGSYKTMRSVTFLFATFQTMRDHREEFTPSSFAYIIVDEAHHTPAETYQPTVDYFEPQFLLGLTATKDRMDGQDILDTYEQILYNMDIYDGWEQGWLARVDYRIMLDDLKQEEFEKYVGPHATTEKVSLAQLNKTIFAPQHDEGIVASIREQTADLDNPKIFIFCSGIEHAEVMAHCFEGEAAVIHSGQSSSQNDAILRSFRSGDIRVIISIDMLNEGIDVPETDAIVFLRSTESSTIFFQQLGRGLRISGGKRIVRVLDYVANIERIATILEMEAIAKERMVVSPNHHASVRPDPIVVDIPATKFKVKRVDVERLLEKAQTRRSWTKDEILLCIAKLARDLGRTPSISDLRGRQDCPSLGTIIRLFGSYNNALVCAGLTPFSSLSREEALKLIADNSVDGVMPRRKVFDETPGLPWGSTILRALGVDDWASAAKVANLRVIDAAGIELSGSGREEYIIYNLHLYYAESLLAEHWLTAKEIDENASLKTYGFYARIFGSMANLRKKATELCCTSEQEIRILTQNGRAVSYDDRKRSSTRMSDQYMLDGIVRLTQELKHKPSCAEIDKCPYLPTAGAIRNRLNANLQEIYELCNLDEVLLSMGVHQIKKERRIIEPRNFVFNTRADGTFELFEHQKKAMQGFVRQNGRKLKKRDLCKANGLPSESSFRYVGMTMQQVNDLIGADQILAEMKKEKDN